MSIFTLHFFHVFIFLKLLITYWIKIASFELSGYPHGTLHTNICLCVKNISHGSFHLFGNNLDAFLYITFAGVAEIHPDMLPSIS